MEVFLNIFLFKNDTMNNENLILMLFFTTVLCHYVLFNDEESKGVFIFISKSKIKISHL
jgi:hypothetical protein